MSDLATFTAQMTDLTSHRIEGIATMGNTPFSCPIVSHVEGNLWQGGCLGGARLPDDFRYVLSREDAAFIVAAVNYVRDLLATPAAPAKQAAPLDVDVLAGVLRTTGVRSGVLAWPNWHRDAEAIAAAYAAALAAKPQDAG